MLRFNFETGEWIAPDVEHTADFRWMFFWWMPYYTLTGAYIGCKCSIGYYSPIHGFVDTYEELAW